MDSEDLIEARKRLGVLLKAHYQSDQHAQIMSFLERFSDLLIMVRVANIFIIAAKSYRNFAVIMDIMDRQWRYVWYGREKSRFSQPFIDANGLVLGNICRKLEIPLLDSNTRWLGPLRVVTVKAEYFFGGRIVGDWRIILGRKKLPVIIECVELGRNLELNDPNREHSDVSGIVIHVERLEAFPER